MSEHLATSWKPVDTTTWEFKLRENVRFHDGTPLTADDVVFSIRRAQAETSSEKDTLEKIAGVEAIDPHTVHVTTERPAAVLWYDLSYVRIMSKAWAERHGVTLPADYDNEVYVPLYQSVGVWPMREELDLPADPLLVPHFRLARFIVPSRK